VKRTTEQLDALAHSLRARGPGDAEAMGELCQVLWELGRQDEAVGAFRLLRALACPGPDEPPGFEASYEQALLATGTCPTPLQRRLRQRHLIGLLRSTTGVPGDVAECGCFRGMSSHLICSFLRMEDARFDGTGYHVFDSFQGLSDPTDDDAIPPGWSNEEGLRMMTQRGSFAAPLAEVQDNLRAFPGIRFHAGWIPLTFRDQPERSYRFVHVDVDLFDPTLDAFAYFYPRLAPGGIVITDDYSWPGARQAVHEYAADHGLEVRVSPYEQAYLRNPRTDR